MRCATAQLSFGWRQLTFDSWPLGLWCRRAIYFFDPAEFAPAALATLALGATGSPARAGFLNRPLVA